MTTFRLARVLALSSVAFSIATSLCACKSIDQFTTEPGEFYCGNIVQGAFVRSGFGPAVQLKLTFDADAIATSPGVLSTDDKLFVEAPLEAIPQIAHDPISTLQFGEGRQRNLIFSVEPSATSGGPPAMVFLSLLDGGGAEVRIVRPASQRATADDVEHTPLFGVFPLNRQREGCKF
ncbi:MAG: hypothetical protein U0165_09620 [Polyangiaceae bacterium]